MSFLSRARRWLTGPIARAGLGIASAGCYSAGAGQGPPTDGFNFPVGLAVSAGGNVLYVANSDFDLQWNGGTLQSYDLRRLRADAASAITTNVDGGSLNCKPPGTILGQGCAPPQPMPGQPGYLLGHAIIGAFATDLQLSSVTYATKMYPTARRLYAPIRGNASVTWAEVPEDAPCAGATCTPNGDLFCKQGPDGTCDRSYQAGNTDDNSRHVTMPGEPFGMAQTEDGTALAVTHQTDTKTSLLTTGLGPTADAPGDYPKLQFVLDGVPSGGSGIAAVPHDPDAVPPCIPPTAVNTQSCPQRDCVRPAFLETSHNFAELDLLRYYDDDCSTLHRPFLQREAAYPLTANAIGSDSRGIVIDPTPRLACKADLVNRGIPDDTAANKALYAACGRKPARVFFANRTPNTLVRGQIGIVGTDGGYYPDAFAVTGTVNIPAGPSKVVLAPVVDPLGHLQLRVFVACFDSNSLVIYDPDNDAIESTVYSGPGPFAMAFDPMPLECIAASDPHSKAWTLWHCPSLSSYRFGYVASFVQSYLQLIDLDAQQPSAPYTFEQFVYTLGTPTPPKGQ